MRPTRFDLPVRVRELPAGRWMTCALAPPWGGMLAAVRALERQTLAAGAVPAGAPAVEFGGGGGQALLLLPAVGGQGTVYRPGGVATTLVCPGRPPDGVAGAVAELVGWTDHQGLPRVGTWRAVLLSTEGDWTVELQVPLLERPRPVAV